MDNHLTFAWAITSAITLGIALLIIWSRRQVRRRKQVLSDLIAVAAKKQELQLDKVNLFRHRAIAIDSGSRVLLYVTKEEDRNYSSKSIDLSLVSKCELQIIGNTVRIPGKKGISSSEEHINSILLHLKCHGHERESLVFYSETDDGAEDMLENKQLALSWKALIENLKLSSN
jgi:hypothetical protein